MFIRRGHGEPSENKAMHGQFQLFSAALIESAASRQNSFGFMLGQPDVYDQLPVSPATVEGLKVLGEHMKDPLEGGPDSNIPAAYTYFGQFVDHDITFDNGPIGVAELAASELVPRGLAGLVNERTASVDLDSVYFPEAPCIGERLEIGEVTALGASKNPYCGRPANPISTICRVSNAATIRPPTAPPGSAIRATTRISSSPSFTWPS